MAITYTPTTNFGAKDSLPTNDPDKVIKGSEFTTEFTALQTAFSLAAPNASPTFTGTVTIPTADINGGNIDGTIIGATTTAAGSFTTGQFGTSLNVDGTVTADGLTVANTAVVAGDFDGGTAATYIRLQDDTDNFLFGSNNSLGNFLIKNETADALRLSVANNGDISFYENTGTTPKFFWDASAESLGIGTTSPNYNLTSYKAGANANYLQVANGSTGPNSANGTLFGIDASGNGVVNVQGAFDYITSVGGTERMRIDSSGNVGIGTSSPQTRLSVETSGVQSVISPVITGQSSGVTYGGLYTIRDGAGDQRGLALQVFTANVGLNEAMRITSAGNVGIGTASPATALSFPIGSSTVVGQTASTDHLVGNVGSLGFGISDGGGGASGVFVHNTHNGTYSSQDIRFLTAEGGISVTTERMRIDSSGNVGIGTSSPAQKLDINGTVRISNGTFGGYFGAGNAITITGASTDFCLRSDSVLSFASAGPYERARIDSSGNFMVGTTSALSGSPISFQGPANDNQQVLALYNPGTTAATTYLQSFATNTAYTERGYITWNGSTMSLSNASDIRLKENVLSAPSALPVIDSIKVKSFDFKEDGRHVDYGVIAQELYKVFPSAVSQGRDKEDGSIEKPWAVGLEPTIPLLIKAIQEQQEIINDLRARVAQLEGA